MNGSPSTYTTAATSNRLLSVTNPARTFSYDAAGNTISDSLGYTGTYNLAGRLTTLAKAGVTTTYSYNALGQRVRKHNNLGSTDTVIFVYDFNTGMLLGEYGPDESTLREYVWIDGMPVAMMTAGRGESERGAAGVLHPLRTTSTRRASWSTATTTCAGDGSAEPFGTTAAETNPAGLGAFTQNLRFPGQYFDAESGLHYNFHRFYDPTAGGRYTTPDPLGLDGGDLSLYIYAHGSPLSYVDPFWATGPGQRCRSATRRKAQSATANRWCVWLHWSCVSDIDGSYSAAQASMELVLRRRYRDL